MPILPISKNQPVDYATLQSLVTTVNDLETKVDLKSGNSAINRTVARTGDTVIVASVEPLTGTAKANTEMTYQWKIGDIKGVTFKSPPVVTATIVSDPINESVVGNSAFVSISKVSIGQVDVRIRFTQDGPINLSLSLIAVGLSATS
jgi:hypothetical protein